MKVGDRVGCVLSSNPKKTLFLGFGVYEGNFFRTDEDVVEDPRIKLDNGDVVWGSECWWGPEERVRSVYVDGNPNVEYVSIVDFREGRI